MILQQDCRLVAFESDENCLAEATPLLPETFASQALNSDTDCGASEEALSVAKILVDGLDRFARRNDPMFAPFQKRYWPCSLSIAHFALDADVLQDWEFV